MADNISPQIMIDPVNGYRYEATLADDFIALWAKTPNHTGFVGETYPHTLQEGDIVRIESLPDSNDIVIYLNGEEIIREAQAELTSGHPGIHAWVTSTSVDRAVDDFLTGQYGGDTGGLTITAVNGSSNKIVFSEGVTVNGAFPNTINSVLVVQGDKIAPLTFTQGPNQLNCSAVDFHEYGIFDGNVRVLVSDDNATVEASVLLDFAPYFDTYIAQSVDLKGVFKYIQGAKAGDYLHIQPLIGSSAVTVDVNGMYAIFNPAPADNTAAIWYHGDPVTKVWTRQDAIITSDYTNATLRKPWNSNSIGNDKTIKFYF